MHSLQQLFGQLFAQSLLFAQLFAQSLLFAQLFAQSFAHFASKLVGQ